MGRTRNYSDGKDGEKYQCVFFLHNKELKGICDVSELQGHSECFDCGLTFDMVDMILHENSHYLHEPYTNNNDKIHEENLQPSEEQDDTEIMTNGILDKIASVEECENGELNGKGISSEITNDLQEEETEECKNITIPNENTQPSKEEECAATMTGTIEDNNEQTGLSIHSDNEKGIAAGLGIHNVHVQDEKKKSIHIPVQDERIQPTHIKNTYVLSDPTGYYKKIVSEKDFDREKNVNEKMDNVNRPHTSNSVQNEEMGKSKKTEAQDESLQEKEKDCRDTMTDANSNEIANGSDDSKKSSNQANGILSNTESINNATNEEMTNCSSIMKEKSLTAHEKISRQSNDLAEKYRRRREWLDFGGQVTTTTCHGYPEIGSCPSTKFVNLKCDGCGKKSFRLSLNFYFHKEICLYKKRFNCPRCKVFFDTFEKCQEHISLSYVKPCKKKDLTVMCHCEDASESKLIKVEKPISSQKQITCHNCQAAFTADKYKLHISLHKKYEEQLIEYYGEKGGDDREVSFRCWKTFKNFESASELIAHKDPCEGDCRFMCQMCLVSHRRAMDIKLHNETRCGLERYYKCKYRQCRKKFSTFNHLLCHNSVHNKEFKCQSCDKAFNSSTLLYVHLCLGAKLPGPLMLP